MSQAVDCSVPNRFLNGIVSLKNFERTTKYTCCYGYKLYGNEERSCTGRGWEPSRNPTCKPVRFCTLPSNMKVSNGSSKVAIGEEVSLYCKPEYKLPNSLKLLPALCDCNGKWNITIDPSPCKEHFCSSPPSSPIPGGMTQYEDESNTIIFPIGSRVNYTCPNGYGLDGIPYRVCTDALVWEPLTSVHRCWNNRATCSDPGIPENGMRYTKSFAVGSFVYFRCKTGFKYHGSHYRTCEIDDRNNTFWSGREGYCKSNFKPPLDLAVQLKRTFTDRTRVCVNEPIMPTIKVTTPPLSTPTDSASCGTPTCRCIDLICIVDCSMNMGVVNFKASLGVVVLLTSWLDIDCGNARVALITYDREVYPRFQLGEKKTRKETIQAIIETDFCGGIYGATGKVLKYVREKVIPMSRPECIKVIFLFSGRTNYWARDSVEEANALKQEEGLEIYTIGFMTLDDRVEASVLKSLASNQYYYFPVKDASDIRDALIISRNLSIDYCSSCGISVAPKCRQQPNGTCISTRGAWPWMVAIYRLEQNQLVFHCEGVIINECMILTAAHCVIKDRVRKIYYWLQELLVVVGDTTRFVNEYSEKTYTIAAAFVHPEYNEGGAYNRDIALLKLSCNIICSPYVQKICLPTPQDRIFYRAGTASIVAGWGTKSTSMNEQRIHIASIYDCINSASPQNQKDVTSYTVCAGDGTGACNVSGGSLLFVKRRGQYESEESVYIVVGIFSWSQGCRQRRNYGIFTNILSLIDWVRFQILSHPCSLPPLYYKEEKRCSDPPFDIV